MATRQLSTFTFHIIVLNICDWRLETYLILYNTQLKCCCCGGCISFWPPAVLTWKVELLADDCLIQTESLVKAKSKFSQFSPSALSEHAEDQAKCADAEEGAVAHGDLS